MPKIYFNYPIDIYLPLRLQSLVDSIILKERKGLPTTTDTNDRYLTSDLAIASYLILKGLVPESIYYPPDDDAAIVFPDKARSSSTALNFTLAIANDNVANFHHINRVLVKTVKQRKQWGEIHG